MYSGGTIVTGNSTLSVSNDNDLGLPTAPLTLDAGTLLTTSGITSTRPVFLGGASGTINTGANSDTLSGRISDLADAIGSLRVIGGGTLMLTNPSNSYHGGTTVTDNSTLNVNDDHELGAPPTTDLPAALTLDAGTLLTTGATFKSGRAVFLGTGGGTIDTGAPGHVDTLSGPISDLADAIGSLRVIGGGTMMLTNLTNSYRGGTTVTGNSTLSVNDDRELGAPPTVDLPAALTLDAGTLLTTAGITSTRPVFLGGGGGTIDTGANSDTLSGQISDTMPSIHGSLTVTGGILIGRLLVGSLTLTNPNNTYSGGTTVTPRATLIVSTDSNLGDPNAMLTLQGSGNDVSAQFSKLLITPSPANFSSTRPIVLSTTGTGGGIVAVATGGSATLKGIISGAGTLAVGDRPIDQRGTLVLGGANTYTGGTEVDFAGTTLSISNDHNLGDPNGAGVGLFQGGTLQIRANGQGPTSVPLNRGIEFDMGTIDTGGNVVTLLGPIDSVLPTSGTGSDQLTVTGGGTLVLSAVNFYKADTFVTGNTTLSVASDSNLGFGSTSHADGSTSPSVLTLDGGTLLTTADFTSARPISLGPDGDGTIDTGGHMDMLSGVISGSGGLTVASTPAGGTLILTGVNTYTGPTTVNAGTLVVGTDSSGKLGPGMVTVNSGGTLRGVGSIPGSVTNNSGTVAPGVAAGSVGTLSVGGSYSQTGAGTFAAAVSPGSASRLTVAGGASLAGTLGLDFDLGSYAPRRYTLLSAQSVTGTFGTVTVGGFAPPLLSSQVSYGSTEVDLDLVVQAGAFPAAAATPNQLAVAQALGLALPTASGDMAAVFDDLVALPTLAQVQNAFGELTGVVYTTVPTVALDNAQMVSGLVFRQLDNAELLARAAGASTPVAAGPWVSLLGDTDTYQGDGNAPGFSSQTYGALVGYDVPLNAGLSVGGLLGTWHKIVSLSDGSGASASLTSVLVGAYGGYTAGPWMAHAVVGYTFDNDTGTRPLTFASRTATSSFNPNEFLGAVEGGYRFQAGSATVTPAVGLQYAHFNQPAFTEQGADALNLSVNGGSTDSLQGLFGVRATYVSPSEGHPVKVTGYAVYSHEFENTSRLINVQLQGAPNAPFTITGVSPARDGVRLGMSVGAMLSDRVEVSGGYDVLWSSNQTFQTYNLNFKYHF
jgi:autotransporter-associated beta strand protein